MPSMIDSHASPAIRLRSSAAAQLPAIRSDSSSNPPSTTTAEAPAWRCWVAMAPQVADRPSRSRAISSRSLPAADSAAAARPWASSSCCRALSPSSSATAWRRCSSVLAWLAARRSRSDTSSRYSARALSDREASARASAAAPSAITTRYCWPPATSTRAISHQHQSGTAPNQVTPAPYERPRR